MQQFALKQFLSLDPEVLIVSIDRELETEDAVTINDASNDIASLSSEEEIDNDPILTLKKLGSFKTATPQQIDQDRFQTNFISNIRNVNPITSQISNLVNTNTQFFQMGPFQ